MSQKYENIMVAVGGSHEAELAFEKGLAFLFITALNYVIDTRALQSVSTLMLRSEELQKSNSAQ